MPVTYVASTSEMVMVYRIEVVRVPPNGAVINDALSHCQYSLAHAKNLLLFPVVENDRRSRCTRSLMKDALKHGGPEEGQISSILHVGRGEA